ncbi:hypothetical protein SAMN05421678_103389 [Actinopolymorpha cephalotaxi]|uniref:Prenyltransferase and squalene oxidase repeat-containing protein n=1 Tax=Actinopolymorpha cephalotaxi TaxID=504797 RepID=A0A1I2NKT0_9ACTN|nr:hypothetical protein [Actinopolymorpha cephalotaxi]NYH85503.1 hypothetical protein [Actinopolymorpha cephalotaxi]SFG03389.1 hypothetical protein SAMN05421678_103389 [Actinopolymorpha cephalotaxi]
MVDLSAASSFVATHARLLERRRFGLLTGQATPDQVVTALVAYRNPDGGFGSGLEPDLRSASSQPVGALGAFEVLGEVATTAGAVVEPGLVARTMDWLDSVTGPDGGVPFVLPTAADAAHAPQWTPEPDPASSLHLTAAVAAAAHRIAGVDTNSEVGSDAGSGVAAHPWLRRATDYCWAQLTDGYRPAHAIELRYVVEFLDAVPDRQRARAVLESSIRPNVPAAGDLAVAGGAEGERQTTTDLSPLPDSASRVLFDPRAVDRDLSRLAAGQRADGGWTVDWAPFSELSDLEWRGIVTVRALRVLAANDRIDLPGMPRRVARPE